MASCRTRGDLAQPRRLHVFASLPVGFLRLPNIETGQNGRLRPDAPPGAYNRTSRSRVNSTQGLATKTLRSRRRGLANHARPGGGMAFRVGSLSHADCLGQVLDDGVADLEHFIQPT